MDTPADAKPIDASFPVEIVDAFVAATATAFQELCGVTVSASAPFATARRLPFDVTATMLLRHDPPGQLVLSFSLPVLESLTRRYAGDDANITPEFLDDAAGEFLNVVAGQAKTMLKGNSAHYLLSMPVVSRTGNDVKESMSITWTFDSECGPFVLQLQCLGWQ